MAAAETARLIASLELQDKNFTRGIRNVERGVGRVDKKLSAFGGFVNRNLARGVDRFAASLVDGVFAGVESLKGLEQQQAQTNAVIKSTGAIAGVSGEEVTKLAEKYEGLNAIIGDEIIRSGENMLLTFTNIRKDAFEPTLEAVLDMNTALGKGPEGLTSTALQVGKALNDPTKGLTKLQRAGVNFTKGQIKQIKALQKSGDLLGAQKIILAELNKEFGGSFAAQGDTTAGKVAKFNDAVEDLQRTFAKALLPIISKVADKLGTFLGDPAVVKGIEDAGIALGQAFDGLLATAERLPWREIGQGLGVARDAAKGILDAFLSMPPWVQTLLIGGVVANKLTGGLVKDLASGLIKGVLGMNAGVVNLTAGVVNGGGVPGGAAGAAGGASKLMNAVRILGAVTIAGASIAALAVAFKGFIDDVGQNQADLLDKVIRTNEQGFDDTVANLKATNANIKNAGPLENLLKGIFGGSEIALNLEMAADRLSKLAASGELSRSELASALAELKQTRETNPVAELPKTDQAIKDLTRAIREREGGNRDPKQTANKPGRVSDPGILSVTKGVQAVSAKQAATTAAVKNAQSVASRENSAQRSELGNIKNGISTMTAQQQAQAAAQVAVTTAGNMLSVFQSAKEVLTTAGTTTAVNSGTAATRGVAPPIVGALSGVGSRIVSAIWAARPVVQSTNVVNNYTTRQRTGSTSGSRNTSPLSTHRP